ncbi:MULTISPECIES: FkbM family methyltransferase [Actinoplanes]|uniref:FkbM family methyltransferase n=1 Tax=Actinoplanes TaxID=1865 RepID=UPI000697A1E7|nr:MULTISPECIES: FkbM family methyltransferase [Actinoplanes]GLY03873.1 hypothetical protein Acsp01_42520 [Actinoplanes sp. NBRC 101535]
MHEEWTTWLAAIMDDPAARLRCTDLLTDLFLDLTELAAPALFVEAGAHEATASTRVKRRLPECRVIAFEANPYVHQYMSGLHDFRRAGVEYRHEALADGPPEVTFRVVTDAEGLDDPRYHGFSSLNSRHHDQEQGVVYANRTVPATTLDDVGAAVPGRTSLWVDVEGAARQVLLGGPEFLSRCDVVLIEVEDVPFWRDQWLVADVVTELQRHGLVPLARDVEYDQQYNMVLASNRLLELPACHTRTAAFKSDLSALSRPA